MPPDSGGIVKAVSAGFGVRRYVAPMTTRYYASFFVHSGAGRISFEYDGVVEVAGAEPSVEETRGDDLARLVASNLEVSTSDVHVVEWHRLH